MMAANDLCRHVDGVREPSATLDNITSSSLQLLVIAIIL
jgi:hypothetical protein